MNSLEIWWVLRVRVTLKSFASIVFLKLNIAYRRSNMLSESSGLTSNLSTLVLFFDFFDQVGDLLNHWRFAYLLWILLLLYSLCFLALRAHIRIVPIQLTIEAHDSLVLWVVFFVGSKEQVEFIRVTRLLLTVSRFMANDSTCVTPDPLLLVLLIVDLSGGSIAATTLHWWHL